MSKWRWLLPLVAAGGLAGLAAQMRKSPPAPEGVWKDAVPSSNSDRVPGQD
ncbi:MAG: hypothetical protein WD602_08830 [Actinomycetota bacterium]